MSEIKQMVGADAEAMDFPQSEVAQNLGRTVINVVQESLTEKVDVTVK